MNMRSMLLAALALLATNVSNAQVQTGTPPFSSSSSSTFDTVDLANLNAHFASQVFDRAGRGIPFYYNLAYDTSVWYPVGSSGNQTWVPVQNWGLLAQTAVTTGYLSMSTNGTYSCYTYISLNKRWVLTGGTTTWWWNYYVDGWGNQHPLNTSSTANWGSCNGVSYPPSQDANATATDGSGYNLQTHGSAYPSGASTTAWITTREGTVTYPPINVNGGSATYTDRNGNQITVDGSGNFTDTLGTVALTVAGSGTPASPMTFTYKAPGAGGAGVNATVTINYTSFTVATNFGISGIHEHGASAVSLPTSVVLPDNSQYTFTYEATPSVPSAGACTPLSGTYQTNCVTARLASVTLPTGGTISYLYYNSNNNFSTCTTGNNGVFSDGSASCLMRTINDGANSNTWTYTRALGTGAASTTTVTDPSTSANQTVIQFQGIYETQRKTYQGSSSTLLQTINTCYNGAASPCTGTAITLPITRRTELIAYPDNTGKVCKHDQFFDSYGLQTEQDDYDYGAGAPASSPMRKVITVYNRNLTNGIVSMPSSITIQDGNGNTKAQTTYCYDEGTPSGSTSCGATGSPTSTSGTPQHVAITGSRGNATTMNILVSGSTYLATTATYFDTGNVQTATDVNGAQITYAYGACGNSFPTGVSEPLSLSHSMTWNCIGGVLTSLTDENNQVSSVTYNDAYYWRPNGTTDQLGNQTAIWYQPNPTYCCPWMVASALSFNSGNSVVEDVQYEDGLGRTYVDQHPQGPSSSTLDSVSYTFDSNGRPYSVSMPCSIGFAGTCTTPKTTQTYDALDRPLVTTDGGGGTVTFSYSQNDVFVTVGPAPSGENPKRRQLEYDSLGRLKSVCEMTSATGSGTCGQTVPQTGYWTQYTYDALGNLTYVTQNAQQTRTYAYDTMGRLTSETNPESGITSYAYDSDSTCGTSQHDLVKKVDAAGNVTCYTYDPLHRVLSIKHPSGPNAANSPSKYFAYDGSSYWPQLTNTKGRFIGGHTCWEPCTSALITDTVIGYSPRGEISDTYEYTPHSGAYYHSSATYWANRVLNYLSGAAGSTGTYGAGWNVDGEGRVSSNYNTGNNPLSGTTYNSASQPTQISFSSGDSDSFTYDPNAGRMTQYQFNLNGQKVDTGAVTWNANGTLQNLAISDGLNGANSQTCNYQHDDLVRISNVNCSGNQLPNPEFESGNVGWNLNGPWSIVNNPANAQSGSWYLSGSSTTQTAVAAIVNGTNWIPVTPGELLTYGGWIKRLGGTGSMDWTCEIVDANHNLAAWCGTGGVNWSGGTNWQLYSGQVTVPPNGAYVQFYAEIHCCGETDNSLTSGNFDSAFLEGAAAWSQSFSYDAFGNINKSGSMSFAPFYSSATNHITSFPGGCTASYDNDGNVLNDCLHSYSWDAEGHAVTVDGVGITYDALGRMVEQNRSGAYTQFAYSPTGFKMQIMNGQTPVKDFVPLVGGVTAVYADTIYFRHPDWLGSPRFVSAYNRTMYSDTAYAPFGEPYAQAGATDLSFTGMNQDTVSGLYDFPAREYSTQGRWPTPDPAGLAAVDPTEPQSWNRYAYVLNDPLILIDPLGLIWACVDTGTGPVCTYYPDDPSPSNFGSLGTGGGGGGPKFPCMGFVSVQCGLIPPPPPQPIQVLHLVAPTPCKATVGQRIAKGLQGGYNLGMAGVKAVGVGSLDVLATAAAPETGGLTLAAASVVTTYAVTNISGQAVSGMGQLVSAFTGDAEGGEKVSQIGDILSGPVTGISTLVATGNADLAQRNANIEGFATGVWGARQAPGLKERIASSIDAGLSAVGLSGAGCHP